MGRFKPRLGGPLLLVMMAVPSYSQPATTQPMVSVPAHSPLPPPASQATGQVIELNLPDNTELRVLIDYVSRRLGQNIIYDESVGNKQVTIKSPVSIPKDSLLGLLESTLRMKGLMLVDDKQQPNFKRVVAVQNLSTIAKVQEAQEAAAGSAVTQVFLLQNADAARLDPVIKPFLTTPGGNSVALAEQRLLIVTDYASTVGRVGELIRQIDQARSPATIEFLQVKHLEAGQLAQQLSQILAAKYKPPSGGGPPAPITVEVVAEPRTNQVVVLGPKDRVDEALKIAQSIDVSLGLETKTYQFRAVSAERIDRLVKDLIGSATAKRLYQSALDTESNTLVATTTHEIHEQLDSLRRQLDVPVTAEQSPIRFYKLANATAADLLQTIQALEGQGPTGPPAPTSAPALVPESDLPVGVNPPLAEAAPAASGPRLEQRQPYRSMGLTRSESLGGSQATPSLRTNRATVTADANTNSLIVVADPAHQQVYEQLIRTLDRRRPQVLIECTIVALDTSNNFSFGVELSAHRTNGDTTALAFSSFGLSSADPNTGRLTLTPGLGFNGAILSADVADIVLRALSTSNRARVVSAPRILVNDNARGKLESTAEEPYTSINASDTVATTSFSGYVKAGTIIEVLPHISEADHLQLEYSVSLNSFTGSPVSGPGGQVSPPPRQTNAITSEVTIPNGSTVVVGGLNRSNWSKGTNGVPFLSDIPLLGLLFGTRIQNNSNLTLFVFLRPVILRDDQFQDLKYFAERDTRQAAVPGDYPHSDPLPLR